MREAPRGCSRVGASAQQYGKSGSVVNSSPIHGAVLVLETRERLLGSGNGVI